MPTRRPYVDDGQDCVPEAIRRYGAAPRASRIKSRWPHRLAALRFRSSPIAVEGVWVRVARCYRLLAYVANMEYSQPPTLPWGIVCGQLPNAYEL